MQAEAPLYSPWKRRWLYFCKNKRGLWSLRLWMFLLLLSLGAEFIANDKPLYIHYQGQHYLPTLFFYPETTFNGDFETEADYRDSYVQNLITEQDGWMIWPLIPFSYDTIDRQEMHPAPAPPSKRHWLGTDDQQRDVVARIIYGLRISILFGLSLTFLSSIVGITLAALQGYYGGWIDLIGQRLIEIWSSAPSLYVLIILSSLFVPSFWILLLIMTAFNWTSLVGVVRAETLRVRNLDYVRAARALGGSDMFILWHHVLPNAMVSTLSMLPFLLASATVTLASLDFLGLGLPPGSPSLGELVLQGKNNVEAPWLGGSAFIIIGGSLTMLVFIGEAVRDAFHPGKAL